MNKKRIAAPALVLALALGVHARAVSDRAIDYLEKTAPRPAGMGGAFMAVPGDPIGMFWNPSAAMRADRLAISGNHSLRHFPGPRRNLDQFDSDTTGIIIPLEDDVVMGIGFSLPGEWGIDYTDTNGLLPEREKLRGRERRIAFTGLHDGAERTGAAYVESDWYRYTGPDADSSYRSFDTGGGFSFFYEDDNGMSYGVNFRGISRLFKGGDDRRKKAAKVTLGAAYRPDPNAATLVAADVELSWGHGFETRWFGGVERAFDRRVYLRIGNMAGMPTYGAGGRFGSLRLDYAVVKNLLPRVSGCSEATEFQDGHFLSYTLSL